MFSIPMLALVSVYSSVIMNAGRYAMPSLISGAFLSFPVLYAFLISSASCLVSPSFFGFIIFLPSLTSFTSQSPSISVFMFAGLMNNSFSILDR